MNFILKEEPLVYDNTKKIKNAEEYNQKRFFFSRQSRLQVVLGVEMQFVPVAPGLSHNRFYSHFVILVRSLYSSRKRSHWHTKYHQYFIITNISPIKKSDGV